ncbi:MAG: hypothetical protein IPI16_22310 [Comamonadaceae bacterium]|nr:hypothetical protein [Comamonadaceae bacterium]MBK6556179.1 hypothetical protein [Comamonadaceae bacterium]MBK7510629.1 hypothetical protein [Comamonadaceae bacterium]
MYQATSRRIVMGMWKIGVALIAAAFIISAVNAGARAQALYTAQVVVALVGLLVLLAAGVRALVTRQARRSVEK